MINRLRVPVPTGAVALLLGVAALVLASAMTGGPAGLVHTTAWLAVVYFVAALLLGLLWPRPSWAWGLWVVLPLAVLLLSSLLFSGQLGAFVRHDLVPLAAAVASALAGGAAGSVLKQRLSGPRPATGA